MAGHVAFLRGIGPHNPNMRNENLRSVFEALGYRNVQSVISSGNIIFDSDSSDIRAMQRGLEEAWPQRLDFASTTIIWSRDRLRRLVDADPFRGLTHGRESYLLVTFCQDPPTDRPLPEQPDSSDYRLLGMVEGALCTVTDTTASGGPDPMGWLEKHYGRRISSRTWKTVQRILARMDAGEAQRRP